MARYNSALTSNTITGTATIGSPYSGAFTEFTGTAPYTVTLPTPVAFPGVTQTFYNATSGTVTLSAPAGNFVGTGSSGASTVPIYSGNVVSIVSDGSNYVVISEDGSPLIATTGAFSSNVTINGGSATLSVTPSVVTMAPTASSTIDNIAIGSTTRASGAFTTLTANNAVTFTANTASSSTGTGSLVVTGGIGASGTIYAGAFNGNLTGTLQTAAQPNITSTGSLTIPGLTVSQSSGAGGIAVGSNADRAQYQYVNFGGGNGGVDYAWQIGRSPSGGVGPSDGFYIYDIKATATRLSIDGSGNVGIGTTIPRVKLAIDAGSVASVSELVNLHNQSQTSGHGTSLTFSGYLAPSAYPTWRFAGIRGMYDTASAGANAAGWGGQLRFFVNRGATADDFEDVLNITTGGRVGIGTTNPVGKLSVIGGGVAGATTYLGGTVDDGLMLGYVPVTDLAEIIGVNHAFSTYNNIGLRAGNNTQLYLSTNGNVGIGSTTPAGILDVGDNRLSSHTYLRNNGNYGGGGGGQTTFNMIFGGVPIAIINNTGTGQRDGQFRLLDENVTKVNIVANASRGGPTYFNGGNVGIGITDPRTLLQVAVPSQNYVSFGNTSYGAGDWYGIHVGYCEGANTYYRKHMLAYESLNDGAARGNLHLLVNTTYGSASATIADSKLMISGTTGNVGIGTNNPTFKLHVNGTSSFEDTVKHKRFTTHAWDGINGGWYPFGADTTARYEIARIAIDYNDWNVVGQTIIEINQIYYSTGGYSKWAVNYGYVQNSKVTLLETNSDWSGASVTVSSPVQVSGDVYYISVYVNVYGYHQQVVKLTTSVNVTTDNITPPQGSISLQKSPTAVNLGAGSSGLSLPEYSETNYNHKINGRLATSYYAHNWLFGNERFVQMRGGKRYGTGTYSLFTRGNGSAQSSGKVYVQAIYGTPSTAGSWEYVISGDKNISQIVANTSIYAGSTPSIYWSGDTLYASNGNSSTYYTVIVELHNIGNHWDATFGDLPGFVS